MPRYRFSWDAFDDRTVSGLALSLGYRANDDESARAFLQRKVKRPSPDFVGDHKDAILDAWLSLHEGMAKYLYQRLVDEGLGPIDYRPRSHKGYVEFLARTRNSKRFREFVADAMIVFGDRDRPSENATPDHLPRFAIVKPGEAPEDTRRPHDYQEAAWEALSAHLAEAEADGVFQGLLVMPTGAGKTFTAVRWLSENVLARGGRVVWLAHRHELLEHAASEFHRCAGLAGHEALRVRIVSGAHAATTSIGPEDDVVVCGIASLARRPDVRSDLVSDSRVFVVIDEAHHAPAKSYRDLLKDLVSRKKFRVLGLTATPTRTLEDERPVLSRLFGGRILYQVGLRRLIERGTLARPRIVRVETGAEVEDGLTDADLQHLQRFQDLSQEWLDRIAHLSGRNQLIVDHYLANREKYGPTLVFAINVAHAALLTAELVERGVRADYVASYRPDGTERAPSDAIQALRDGELEVLVNVEMVTEGVDVPGIRTVFLARPTSSEILMRQMIGRALRGPAAGGTEHAYLVSFEDHWKHYTEWESPFDLVPDVQLEAERADEAASVETAPNEAPVPVEIVEAIPWDLVTIAARELRRLRAEAPAFAFEAVPYGWYVFEDEGGEDQAEFRHIVPYYAHQLSCWEAAFDHLWTQPSTTVASLTADDLEDFFFDCDDPRPSVRDIEHAIELRARGGDRPAPIPFADRAKSDPLTLAQRILDGNLRRNEQTEMVDRAYEDPLARAVYPTRQLFAEAVDAATRNLERPQERVVMPKAVPIFEQSDERLLTPGPHYDLQELFDEMRVAGARLLELPALPHDGPLQWSKRILKGWYAKAYWDRSTPHGHGRIRVNRLLDSPEVPRDVMIWLLWHEYLHLHLKAGHTATFRQLERRWPGCVEAERFLDTLNEKFGVQAW